MYVYRIESVRTQRGPYWTLNTPKTKHYFDTINSMHSDTEHPVMWGVCTTTSMYSLVRWFEDVIFILKRYPELQVAVRDTKLQPMNLGVYPYSQIAFNPDEVERSQEWKEEVVYFPLKEVFNS